jgi:hypothetical protein
MNLAAKEELLRKSLQANPNSPHVVDTLAELMMSVGRTDEALSLLHRSVQLEPLSKHNAWDELRNNIIAGHLAQASELLDAAKVLWPNEPEFMFAKYNLAVTSGEQIDIAKMEKEIPLLWELMRGKKEDGELLIRVLNTHDKELLTQAIANCFRNHGLPSDEGCFIMMVQEGALDDAFRFAELVYPDYRRLYPKDDDRWLTIPLPGLLPGIETPRLFSPRMAAFRDDPRFWPVAVRTGLVNYWQTTQKWPDFCRDQIGKCQMMAVEAVRNGAQIHAATQP